MSCPHASRRDTSVGSRAVRDLTMMDLSGCDDTARTWRHKAAALAAAWAVSDAAETAQGKALPVGRHPLEIDDAAHDP
jgi:hypothetical protein